MNRKTTKIFQAIRTAHALRRVVTDLKKTGLSKSEVNLFSLLETQVLKIQNKLVDRIPA